MTKRPAKNVSASAREKLLNKARQSGRPFSKLLQYFAMERFLYRSAKSQYGDKFILKDALMLAVWKAPSARPTMDIDLLGWLGNDRDKVVGIMKKMCDQKVASDGIVFDDENVSGERITEAVDYEGIRIRLRGNVGTGAGGPRGQNRRWFTNP
ncbi:nucleotidyl transferase AbiEii/AbiGii toxin family protein [Candidatus Poribacteria bacterium]|nr:nucleotidyl transferase AbiEii/AbiGii toxin family protein [Candidatus Poribacteria bacterium]